jgi:DNA-directed RNA polymerase specialized sigma24 family protein
MPKDPAKIIKGEKVHTAVLTEKAVLEIRKCFGLGWSYRKIAETYNISITTVWSIAKRKTWKHI